jgi:NAD(P) transhydrogenase subunit beta
MTTLTSISDTISATLAAGWSLPNMKDIIELAYMISAGLFIFSLHWMSDPKTARRGVFAGVAAMAMAVLFTWAKPDVTRHLWIIIPLALSVWPGIWLANVPLTAVPQRTALSHAFGGLAAGLVGTAKFLYWFHNEPEMLTSFRVARSCSRFCWAS